MLEAILGLFIVAITFVFFAIFMLFLLFFIALTFVYSTYYTVVSVFFSFVWLLVFGGNSSVNVSSNIDFSRFPVLYLIFLVFVLVIWLFINKYLKK